MVAAALRAPDAPESVDSPRLFGRNVVWGVSAGGSSMVVHLALLLILGLMITPQFERPQPPVLESRIEQERPDEQLTHKLPKQPPVKPSTKLNPPTNHNPGGTDRRFPSPTNKIAAAQLRTAGVASGKLPQFDVGVQRLFTQSSGALSAAVPQGSTGEPLSTVRGYDEAMDRMTQEILNKLVLGKVLVVWLFDQSESMQDDRDEILKRVDNVYAELGLARAADSDELMTSVLSFGATTPLHTPQPTADRQQIKAAMREVPVDPTGREMMCSALSFAVAQHQKYAQQSGRQLLCILVTDESGDAASNFAQLEATIAQARAARATCYVLGREAVFGYPYAHLRWVDPETKIDFWLRIDRGPESPYPEQLQVDGLHRRFDAHPSGFGPYEQSRIARQTGGVFFLLPTPEANLWRRDDRDYDADAMRPYLPDLSSRADYAAERDKHPLRATLWKVIGDLNPYDKRLENVVQVRFWDWPIDRAAFAREAEANIKKARNLIGYFAQAEQALDAVRPYRAREPSLRWRANYDVAYAQTIAYQARLHDYIAYVAAFVEHPKPIRNELGIARPTNAWDGHNIKRTLANEPAVARLREKSSMLFRQVAADHPGTPWAARAEYELARGFGCEFREDYEDPRRRDVKLPQP